MSREIKYCLTCNSNKISTLFNVNNFPYFTSPINKKIKRKIKNSKNLKNYFSNLKTKYCLKCFHVFLANLPNEKMINTLYKKYYNYPSAMMGEFLPSRDLSFLKFIKSYLKRKKINKNNSFYEIGCFDGFILYNLKKFGYKLVSGCDPSIGSKIAKKFSIKVYKEFFDINSSNLKNKNYDFVIARHLLEHIANPKKFFSDLEKITNINSKIIIEVPNGNYYLKKGLIEVFSHQHLHLFNKYSMKMLISNTNFYIEAIKESNANLYFVLSKQKKFQKVLKKNLITNFKIKYKKNIFLLNNILKKFKNKKLVFYGAGGFCCAATHLYKIDKKRISSIIDSDSKKAGKEFIDIDVEVQKKDVKYDENYLMIITSYYSKEILKYISKNKIVEKVATIHPDVRQFNLK